MKQAIETENAPAAVGPYSQAIKVDGLLFCSGQIPINPANGTLIEGSISEETHQVMKNLAAVLEAGGCSLNQVVKTTIFLEDMNNFAEVNEIYASYFEQPFPARACVQAAKLPKNVRVEIEAIAKVS